LVTVFCLASRDHAAREVVAGVTYQPCGTWYRRGATKLSPARNGMLRAALGHELVAALMVEPVAAARPDIIHAHGFAALTASVRAARQCGARVIYDPNGSAPADAAKPGPLLQRWISAVELRGLRRVSAIIASPWQADRLIELYAAVADGPKGLPAAMARHALASPWQPARPMAFGG
jgi:hypothetical protein